MLMLAKADAVSYCGRGVSMACVAIDRLVAQPRSVKELELGRRA